MTPLLKILLVIIAGLGGIFTIGSFLGKDTSNIMPQNASVSEDAGTNIWNWFSRFPLGDFLEMIISGTWGVAQWLADGFNIMAEIIIHIFNPKAELPLWFGFLGVAAIFGILIWTQGSNVVGFGYNALFWIILILLAIVFIGMVLSMLGAFA